MIEWNGRAFLSFELYIIIPFWLMETQYPDVVIRRREKIKYSSHVIIVVAAMSM